ncbi:MAG: biopolymer transporter ExbD [Acidobacteriia bacterium]|nr:biopolymer transporter ExbD [Terriglobia bacterium]
MGIKRSTADINVTPMIDVLLVLLIIFMVVLPERSVGLDVQVPPQTDDQVHPLPTRNIVLTVLGGGKVRLDQADLNVADLPDRLRWLQVRYTAGVAFVKGENELDFAQVAEVIDVAKGAGWKRISLMPK